MAFILNNRYKAQLLIFIANKILIRTFILLLRSNTKGAVTGGKVSFIPRKDIKLKADIFKQ